MASSVPGMFPIPISPDGPLSPAAGPFIGPVEIRGKKNKKKYFFSPSCQSMDCQIYPTEISKIWGFRKIETKEKKPHWVLFVAN